MILRSRDVKLAKKKKMKNQICILYTPWMVEVEYITLVNNATLCMNTTKHDVAKWRCTVHKAKFWNKYVSIRHRLFHRSSFTHHLECLQLPTKSDRYFPIFRVVNLWHTSVSPIHNHGCLSFLHVYILIENFDLNLFSLTCSRKITVM